MSETESSQQEQPENNEKEQKTETTVQTQNNSKSMDSFRIVSATKIKRFLLVFSRHLLERGR